MGDPMLTVNGLRRRIDAPAYTTALDWLRGQGLTGCKEGCAEGECGACAVLVATDDGHDGTDWTAINACLVPVASLDGQEVVTSEGLGSPDAMHPVQEELATRGGSQCGYCTPGFVCSMASEYYRADRTEHVDGAADPEHGPNGFDLHALSGNLCRCTGYRPIRDAAYALGRPGDADPLAVRRGVPAPEAVATDVARPDGRFVRPADLAEALELLATERDAVLVAGSTDWGVEVNIRGRRAPLVVAIERLPELRAIDVRDDVVEIGAAVTLSEIERELGESVPLLGELIPQFASRLIRNRATIGGNLGTASPIGDTPPALLALGARVVLSSQEGEREVDLADYFTGYRQTLKRADELIRAARIPLPLASSTAFHKIAKRRFDDISSVAVAFALDIEDDVVTSARIGLGGVAATPLRALATEDELIGSVWCESTVEEAAIVLGREGSPMADHRASREYRAVMLSQALLKFYAQTAGNLEVAS